LAGIRAEFDEGSVVFGLAPVESDEIELACPVRHPRLPDREISEVGAMPGLPEFAALTETNDRLRRLLIRRLVRRLIWLLILRRIILRLLIRNT
jgi:hypothetical protein